jgi:ribulose-5-phosphate 4-epimerase/fuculose-1-phosphate aldolase
MRFAADHANGDAFFEDRLPRLPWSRTEDRRTGITDPRSRSGEALILRNHGALIVGRSIGEAFNWTHRLELSCRAQLAAMACNVKFVDVPQPILEETWSNYQPQTRRPYGVMEWPALLRKLDRIDRSFRD